MSHGRVLAWEKTTEQMRFKTIEKDGTTSQQFGQRRWRSAEPIVYYAVDVTPSALARPALRTTPLRVTTASISLVLLFTI
jgi:hypothetical protein